jgi:hypothetical protein
VADCVLDMGMTSLGRTWTKFWKAPSPERHRLFWRQLIETGDSQHISPNRSMDIT